MISEEQLNELLSPEELEMLMEHLTFEEMENLYWLNQELLLRESADFLWTFCKARNEWFQEDRKYLKTIAETLQAVYEGKIINPKTNKPYTKVMLNAPPQFGKSLSVNNFIQWLLGKSNRNRIISISYNEKLSGRIGKAVRDSISEKKVSPEKIIYRDIFPNTEINQADSSRTTWALKEQHFNFLGSSPGGTITGIGANIMIIDDLVKNAMEANNPRILEEQWDFYRDTLLSRAHEGALWFIIMTRWSTKDLCGRLLELEPDDWLVIEFEAMNKDTGEMLCQSVMSRERYEDLKKKTSPEIFDSNYHQQPVDVKGRLYDEFKIYHPSELPRRLKVIFAYCDSANKGKDYTSMPVLADPGDGYLYVLDWLYTKDGMKVTLPKAAEMLYRNNVKYAYFEGNGGGDFYGESVEDAVKKDYGVYSIKFDLFHQKGNKEARIISTAFEANNIIRMPADWKERWPELHKHLYAYQREGTGQLDDCADSVAGAVEKGKELKGSGGHSKDW